MRASETTTTLERVPYPYVMDFKSYTTPHLMTQHDSGFEERNLQLTPELMDSCGGHCS